MSSDEMRTEIETLVGSYAVDLDLAARIWDTTDEVSFIHPSGHERGWDQIKRNFYQGAMGANFSRRKLQVHDLVVHLYEKLAVAEFYWTFDAIFRSDGTPHRSHGRETQVFRRADDRWLLVHVHYSSMPVTGERTGF